ncbi:unnamed protein product [Pylaiella littoralis]
MLPLAPGALGGQRGGKGHGAGRAAPVGGSSSSQPLSGRARSAVADFNGIMQDAQQQCVPVPNGPTCDKCANTKKNPHHEFRSCAFSLCPRCKRGGYRAKKCPFERGRVVEMNSCYLSGRSFGPCLEVRC